MGIAGSMKIRTKLGVMLLCPILALVYLVVAGVWEKWSQASEMDSLLAVSELAVNSSALVHELQKERGMTALFLGSKGTKFKAELDTQRAETDKRIQTLRDFLRGFDRARFGPGFGKSVDEALARLEKNATVRETASTLALSTPEAIAHYTGAITGLLGVVTRSAHLTTEGDMTRRVAAYAAFLQAKERAGIERATLSNTFAQDAFAPGMYERFVGVVAAHDTFAGFFDALAADADREFAHATVTGPVVETVTRIEQVAREKSASGGFGVDPGQWFKASTDRIELMKQVEDRLSAGLVTRARELRRQAWAALISLLVIAVTALGVAAGLGYALARSITTSVTTLLGTMRELAEGEGDLTRRVDVKAQDELGELGRAFNAFMEKLRAIMAQVRSAAGHATSASEGLLAAATQLSSGAHAQAASLEQTAAALEEITATVRQNADNARQASELATGSRDVAEKGSHVVTGAVSSMTEINHASKRIADIITTIDEIAFQTNLLALNAAVEAARAGEQGRGFAVVAAEVRNLAQRSASAAHEIKTLIQDSVGKVDAGSELVNRSGGTFDEIVAAVKRVTAITADIATASQEQTIGIDEVNKAVGQMDQVTQSNATQTEHLTSTAHALAQEAQRLQALVGRFNLGEDAAAPAGRAHGAAATAAPRRSGRVVQRPHVTVPDRTLVLHGSREER